MLSMQRMRRGGAGSALGLGAVRFQACGRRPPAAGWMLLAAAIAGLACAGAERSQVSPRVLIVGIDGASPRVVEHLLAEGRLPHLARIAREGASGKLRSIQPMYSPRVWTTVATGKLPAKHGIAGFVRVDESGERHIFQSGDRRSHALWNIASDAGMSVEVVNWWTTHPPEVIDGVMVTDHLFPEVRDERQAFMRATLDAADAVPVHPASWLERVEGLRDADTRLTEVPDPFTEPERFPGWVDAEFLSYRFRFDETIARIALEIAEQEKPRIVMVLLPGVDKISHFIWGALEPPDELPPGTRFTPEQQAYASEALYRVYEQADALVGRLAASFGPDDLVLALSDHGFHVGGAMGALTGLHKDKRAIDGVIFARGRGIAPGSRAEPVHVKDLTPSVLAWLGLPVGLDMDGRPAGFLDLPPPATVASHDRGPIERVGQAIPAVEERLVEELEALGYLEEGGGEPAGAPAGGSQPPPPGQTAPKHGAGPADAP